MVVWGGRWHWDLDSQGWGGKRGRAENSSWNKYFNWGDSSGICQTPPPPIPSPLVLSHPLSLFPSSHSLVHSPCRPLPTHGSVLSSCLSAFSPPRWQRPAWMCVSRLVALTVLILRASAQGSFQVQITAENNNNNTRRYFWRKWTSGGAAQQSMGTLWQRIRGLFPSVLGTPCPPTSHPSAVSWAGTGDEKLTPTDIILPPHKSCSQCRRPAAS